MTNDNNEIREEDSALVTHIKENVRLELALNKKMTGVDCSPLYGYVIETAAIDMKTPPAWGRQPYTAFLCTTSQIPSLMDDLERKIGKRVYLGELSKAVIGLERLYHSCKSGYNQLVDFAESLQEGKDHFFWVENISRELSHKSISPYSIFA